MYVDSTLAVSFNNSALLIFFADVRSERVKDINHYSKLWSRRSSTSSGRSRLGIVS